MIWLLKWRQPEGQVARWIEILSSFRFNPVHRPGLKHGNADALSRIPCKQCGEGADSEAGEYVEDRKAWAKEMLRKLKLNGYARQIAQYHIEDDSDSSDEDETKVIQAINARPGPSNQPDGSETDSADEETREVGNRLPAANWLRGFSGLPRQYQRLRLVASPASPVNHRPITSVSRFSRSVTITLRSTTVPSASSSSMVGSVRMPSSSASRPSRPAGSCNWGQGRGLV